MPEFSLKGLMLQRSSVHAFFEFMAARERLRLQKESGASWPWTDDPILNTYKFTNVKREHDRTTRWMRENWTRPNEDRPHGEIIFNCALFRYFGTTEFAQSIGWQRSWAPAKIIERARSRASAGERVFTGAYIIPTLGFRGPKAEAVCRFILSPLWERRNDLSEIARTTRRWEAVALRMRSLPGFGGTGFMAKEVLQDVINTPVLRNPIDLNTWCPAGPGARRGLNRIHGRRTTTHVSEAQLIGEMIALREQSFDALPSLMPELELHDVQFQLCEYDKYERVRLGEGRPRGRYKARNGGQG